MPALPSGGAVTNRLRPAQAPFTRVQSAIVLELTQTVRDVEPEEWGGVAVARW